MTPSPGRSPLEDRQRKWSFRLTQTIAGRVVHYRGQRGMNQQNLADACTALGMPIARSTIAGLESGRKDAISVAELVILATALEVPPMLLVLPLGDETTEALPDRERRTVDVARWWRGDLLLEPDITNTHDIMGFHAWMRVNSLIQACLQDVHLVRQQAEGKDPHTLEGAQGMRITTNIPPTRAEFAARRESLRSRYLALKPTYGIDPPARPAALDGLLTEPPTGTDVDPESAF